MQTQASYPDAANPAGSPSSPGEILEAVGALREYMRSMDAQVQELMSERERLHAEVEHLRSAKQRAARRSEPARDSGWVPEPPAADWKHEAHRVTDELEQLVHLYETASRRRARPRRSSRPPYQGAAAEPEQSAWLKKMVMVLMMAELV